MILLASTPPAGMKRASTMWTTVARAPLAEREGRARAVFRARRTSYLRRLYGRTQSHHRLVQRSEALVDLSRGDAGSARTDALRAFRRHHLGEWYFNGFREQRRADHAAALRVSDHRSGVRRRAGADQGAGPGLLGRPGTQATAGDQSK